VCSPPVFFFNDYYVNSFSIICKPQNIPIISYRAPVNLDFAGVFSFAPVEKPVENVDNLC